MLMIAFGEWFRRKSRCDTIRWQLHSAWVHGLHTVDSNSSLAHCGSYCPGALNTSILSRRNFSPPQIEHNAQYVRRKKISKMLTACTTIPSCSDCADDGMEGVVCVLRCAHTLNDNQISALMIVAVAAPHIDSEKKWEW